MGSSLISGSVANSAQTSRVVFFRVRNGAEQEAKAEAKKGEKGGDQPHRKLVDTILQLPFGWGLESLFPLEVACCQGLC